MRLPICMSLFFAGLFIGWNSNAKTIDYIVDNETYEGFYLKKGNNAPTVFLIHDWDGLTEYEIKRAQMLEKEGYSVFALDLFGKGVRPTEVKDKRQHTGELYKNREKMLKLMMAAIAKAKGLGLNTTKSVAMGYCFGGAAVLELARSGANLQGFASFHGGLATPAQQNYGNTTGSIIVFHGTADKMITMDEFAALANELQTAKIPNEMITYGGADHAFTVFDSGRYDAKADRNSWTRFLAYVKETTRN